MAFNEKGLYVQLYCISGLIRGKGLELEKDPESGVYVKYVYEFANVLCRSDKVDKVEIITRYINDHHYSPDYSRQEEEVNDKLSIIRLKCGGNKYIKKDLLWDHLGEFISKAKEYINSRSKTPDILHSHYADAGYVCSYLSDETGIPFFHTGHSLGKYEQKILKNSGWSSEKIEKTCNMTRRIAAEDLTHSRAHTVIINGANEIESQYSLYKIDRPEKFKTLPQGIDFDKFFPFNTVREWEGEPKAVRDKIHRVFSKFFVRMYKPVILSVSIPEIRKNISGLIKAYGEDLELQRMANLAIFAGIRNDISEMTGAEKEVFTEMLLLMDRYNLYGKMAVPKKHNQENEAPELFRMAAESGGVYVNSAFSETFDVSMIEAAASGLPVVATREGGSSEIIKNLRNGILVDVSNTQNIAGAIKNILQNQTRRDILSRNGVNRVRKYYSWEAHCKSYINHINAMREKGLRA